MRLWLLMLSVWLTACASQDISKTSPQVVQGSIDLSQWDFAEQGLVELHGDWLCQGLGEADDCKAPGSTRRMPFTHWRSYEMVRQGHALHSRLKTTLHLPLDQRDPVFLNLRDVSVPGV